MLNVGIIYINSIENKRSKKRFEMQHSISIVTLQWLKQKEK